MAELDDAWRSGTSRVIVGADARRGADFRRGEADVRLRAFADRTDREGED
jgi:hypothetical protein